MKLDETEFPADKENNMISFYRSSENCLLVFRFRWFSASYFENLKSDFEASWTFHLVIFLFVQVPVQLSSLLIDRKRKNLLSRQKMLCQFSKSYKKLKFYVCVRFRCVKLFHSIQKGVKLDRHHLLWKKSQAFTSRSTQSVTWVGQGPFKKSVSSSINSFCLEMIKYSEAQEIFYTWDKSYIYVFPSRSQSLVYGLSYEARNEAFKTKKIYCMILQNI